ncbi:MAG TPA: HPr family phosphocarrier protein [Candidatus Onthomonas avicola]|nr:HPr family phosphocarrier protein [Candidatus Onthomonas avicola]
MKVMTMTVHDKEGLHARPAGLLNKAAKACASAISIQSKGKTADMKRIFAVMGLGVKCGDEITVTCDGPDEDAAMEKIQAILSSL